MVIISTSITESELVELKKFGKKFNAKIVNDYSDEVTHLVTLEAKPNSNTTTRTLKYLKSLLTHKWLLNFSWIVDSLHNGNLEDECDYELLGITKQTQEKLGAPKRSREAANINLFDGKQFYIDKFSSKSALPKPSFEELIKIGGGQLISSDKEIEDSTYVLIDAATFNRSKFKARKNAISTINFLNCVSDFRFD